MNLGICDGCAGVKQLRGDGTIPTHYLAILASRRAVPVIGHRHLRRRCPGSGRPPRHVEP